MCFINDTAIILLQLFLCQGWQLGEDQAELLSSAKEQAINQLVRCVYLPPCTLCFLPCSELVTCPHLGLPIHTHMLFVFPVYCVVPIIFLAASPLIPQAQVQMPSAEPPSWPLHPAPESCSITSRISSLTSNLGADYFILLFSFSL